MKYHVSSQTCSLASFKRHSYVMTSVVLNLKNKQTNKQTNKKAGKVPGSEGEGGTNPISRPNI